MKQGYGERQEGYWMSEKFLSQIDSVVKIAEIKCPKSKGYKSGVGFDNSSCHTPYAEDALIATHMNAKPGGPGGKQVYIISCPWLCDPENI